MANPSLELYILKAFFDYSLYSTYRDLVEEEYIKNNNKELYKILQVIHLFHKNFPSKNITSLEEFESYYLVNYPTVNAKEKENIHSLIYRLGGIVIEPNVAEEIFTKHLESVRATDLAVFSLEVAEGKRSYSELVERAKKLDELRCRVPQADDFESGCLTELLDKTFTDGGFNWRLGTLNSSLGPLRKGDFGFVFARPETGKTTFLASELTNFLDQTDKTILWINNEEQGAKVKLRILQAYFGVPLQTLLKEKQVYEKKWLEETSDRLKVVRSDMAMDRRSIDRLLSRHNPCCIVVDQIDKVKGFTNDRYDLEMKEIYLWGRELAKQYGPVIGVCQAGGTGENKQYLTMDDVDSSKTSKQGEADWILGIGKSHQPGLEHIRFFNICKNKLLGGQATNESLRHGKFQVRIWPEVARYEDIQ